MCMCVCVLVSTEQRVFESTFDAVGTLHNVHQSVLGCYPVAAAKVTKQLIESTQSSRTKTMRDHQKMIYIMDLRRQQQHQRSIECKQYEAEGKQREHTKKNCGVIHKHSTGGVLLLLPVLLSVPTTVGGSGTTEGCNTPQLTIRPTTTSWLLRGALNGRRRRRSCLFFR